MEQPKVDFLVAVSTSPIMKILVETHSFYMKSSTIISHHLNESFSAFFGFVQVFSMTDLFDLKKVIYRCLVAHL